MKLDINEATRKVRGVMPKPINFYNSGIDITTGLGVEKMIIDGIFGDNRAQHLIIASAIFDEGLYEKI